MKKAVIALAVVFLGFWLVSDPRGLADTASGAGSGAWTVTQDLFDSLITFLREL
jgi:hypothetical protein